MTPFSITDINKISVTLRVTSLLCIGVTLKVMVIGFANKKLKRCIENDAERKKHFGVEMARKIKLRIDALSAAESLADLWPPNSGPERCHELKGNLSGIFSVDVKQPYRLLFKPVEGKQESESQDKLQLWREIDEIIIVGIEDTHD